MDMVLSGGVVASDVAFAKRRVVAPVGLDSVKLKPVSAAAFNIPARNSEADVIGVVPGKIITEHLKRTLPVAGGKTLVDLDQDVLKVAVVERHKGQAISALVLSMALA